MREWWTRILTWTGGRSALTGELAEELRAHLEMEVENNIERGMTPEDARIAASLKFGNRTLVAERGRDAWGFPSIESFAKDIRHGLRTMRRAPAFALAVILTLALGIGVNTAIFSVVHAVLLRPLPYPDAERIVWFGEATAKAPGISVTWVNFKNWRAGNHTFDKMAAFQFTELTLTGRPEPLITRGLAVTAPYFSLLGMHPLLGRFFSDGEDRPGAAPVIVLNHSFWANQLGGDPSVTGTTITLNGAAYEVIGVAAPLWEPWRIDYYIPLARTAASTVDRSRHGSMRVLGRLKSGVTLAAARADLDTIMQHLAEADPGPENEHRSFGRFFTEYSTGDMRRTLVGLMSAAVLILLIACANVASLLLARNTARQGELAVRKALGAGRLRLVRQMLSENLVLAIAGGIAGIALAYATVNALIALAPSGIPRLADTQLDIQVLLFACAITLAAGLTAGIAPVIIAGNIDLNAAMKDAGRSASAGQRRQSLRNLLVIAEVALTLVLAFGSALLLRSLSAAENADPGFDPRKMLMFTLQLPPDGYKSDQTIAQFYTRLAGDLRAAPGIAQVSAVACPPTAGDCGDWFYSIPGRPAPPANEVPIALFNTAFAGYFAAMRIPVRQGREFDGTDREGGRKVAIVNETFARNWWPHETAVGHQIKVGGPYQKGDVIEIAGVVGDVRQFGLDSNPMPEIYLPAGQQNPRSMSIVVRAAANPEFLTATVRSRVLALDLNLPLQNLTTMEQALGAGLARRRFGTLLLALFAALAMVLAATGIYGLLNYWVSVREPEIALRLALGARPSMILRWTSFHALRLAVIGIGIGAIAGWAAARVLDDVVFGIPPRNPATLALAALAMVLVALAATLLPAARAARTDAAQRLHHI